MPYKDDVYRLFCIYQWWLLRNLCSGLGSLSPTPALLTGYRMCYYAELRKKKKKEKTIETKEDCCGIRIMTVPQDPTKLLWVLTTVSNYRWSKTTCVNKGRLWSWILLLLQIPTVHPFSILFFASNGHWFIEAFPAMDAGKLYSEHSFFKYVSQSNVFKVF